MSTYDKESEWLSNLGATLDDVSNMLTHEIANCYNDEDEQKLDQAQTLIDQVVEGRKVHDLCTGSENQ